MTEGEKGSILYSEGNTKRIPAVKAKVLDSTGAGDAYKAAFWAGLIHGMDLETSCRLGSVSSSLVIKEKGAQSGLPDWDKLIELYEIHFGGLKK